MILLFTLLEIAILIALLLIIAAAIVVLAIRIKKGKGGKGNTPDASALKALQDLETKLDEVRETGTASADDCKKMRELLEKARSGGVPHFTTNPIKIRIDRLCSNTQ